jgi:hypothetical protein
MKTEKAEEEREGTAGGSFVGLAGGIGEEEERAGENSTTLFLDTPRTKLSG